VADALNHVLQVTGKLRQFRVPVVIEYNLKDFSMKPAILMLCLIIAGVANADPDELDPNLLLNTTVQAELECNFSPLCIPWLDALATLTEVHPVLDAVKHF